LDIVARTPLDPDSVLWREKSTHVMVSGSWDATVKVWSVSVAVGETVTFDREPLAELFDADSSIVCLAIKSLPTGGILIAAGGADGSFCVWNVHSDGVQVMIHKEVARRGSGPCSVVRWIDATLGGRVFLLVAFSTGKIASYELQVNDNEHYSTGLRRMSAVSVGVGILSLVYTCDVVLVGCSDGGLRLIPLTEGYQFHSQPTLWKSVNNKAAPGISCISVATNYRENKSKDQVLCCTGGEDGTVALFELKKVKSD
jgi:WD40 repeat protein